MPDSSDSLALSNRMTGQITVNLFSPNNKKKKKGDQL